MLYRRKVQLIASERMALSSRCLPGCGCTLCHQVQHTNALVHLEMLALSHTTSAAQQQVCSRKTTAEAEVCKIPVWGVSGAVFHKLHVKQLLTEPSCSTLSNSLVTVHPLALLYIGLYSLNTDMLSTCLLSDVFQIEGCLAWFSERVFFT